MTPDDPYRWESPHEDRAVLYAGAVPVGVVYEYLRDQIGRGPRRYVAMCNVLEQHGDLSLKWWGSGKSLEEAKRIVESELGITVFSPEVKPQRRAIGP